MTKCNQLGLAIDMIMLKSEESTCIEIEFKKSNSKKFKQALEMLDWAFKYNDQSPNIIIDKKSQYILLSNK